MIVVRTVFQAQFGKGGELAAMMGQSMQAMTQAMGTGSKWRILTDLSGPFDTVIIEVEEASLAAWEQRQAQMMSEPGVQEMMAKTAALLQGGGRNELYTLESQG